ncbi:MAG: GNAT family N-acetyltransferase [Oscillospiraceae bacterium]|nr:GNAT family N-acetyltransferase [Oscillospiraceae bacterium]
MKYEEKSLTLRNGQGCVLRSPTGSDAEEMICCLRKTASETIFLARYEDEIKFTPDDEAKILSDIYDNPEGIMIAAFIGGRLVANAGFSSVAPYERTRHRAEFGISVLKEYWGLGLGSLLLAALIEAAAKAGYEQLELEVVAENERATALYEKFGFETYGIRPGTFKYRDGVYRSCRLMLKKL